jgi:hypothetical protein
MDDRKNAIVALLCWIKESPSPPQKDESKKPFFGSAHPRFNRGFGWVYRERGTAKNREGEPPGKPQSCPCPWSLELILASVSNFSTA